jgi:hypothetical protein
VCLDDEMAYVSHFGYRWKQRGRPVSISLINVLTDQLTIGVNISIG